jgi:UbiD family decarboxylase
MSLRDTIERLDKQGDLVRVRKEVDRRFELARIPGYEDLDLRDDPG